MTTTTDNLIAAVEMGWDAAAADSLAANSACGLYPDVSIAITAGRAAFRALVTAQAEREKRLREFVERVVKTWHSSQDDFDRVKGLLVLSQEANILLAELVKESDVGT